MRRISTTRPVASEAETTGHQDGALAPLPPTTVPFPRSKVSAAKSMAIGPLTLKRVLLKVAIARRPWIRSCAMTAVFKVVDWKMYRMLMRAKSSVTVSMEAPVTKELGAAEGEGVLGPPVEVAVGMGAA